MANEKRKAADDDTHEETPVLSDWLAGHVRVPISKAIAREEAMVEPSSFETASTPAKSDNIEQPTENPLEPDPALIFLEREGRERQAQRIKVAVIAVGLALLSGGYFLSRRATDPPATRAEAAAAATNPAAPAVLAEQVEPARVQNLDLSEESEPADLHEAVKPGLSAAIGSPRTPADKLNPGAAIPGGPSVARYPDLPREVLIQLEKATQTSAR